MKWNNAYENLGFLPIDFHLGQLCAGFSSVQGRAEGAGSDSLTTNAESSLLQLVAASVSRALRQGHPCLPLEELGGLVLRSAEGEALTSFPDAEHLLHLVRAWPAVSVVDSAGGSQLWAPQQQNTPLILDEKNRLYTNRLFEHEQLLAKKIAIILDGQESEASLLINEAEQSWLNSRLDHYFNAENSAEIDWQREAAKSALLRKFSIISGGPGTGKTSTVVKLLALLVETALRHQQPAPRISLMAPTGKAAARMAESIASALSKLKLAPEVEAAVSPRASTIHRALGVRPDSATRFQHNERRPLLSDVVLVDEASMVDLSLMRHLLDALKPGARLILLGDRFQLASVEAGSVLAELCGALGGTGQGAALPKVDSVVTELQKSYRFSAESGIFALAQSIREGKGQKAIGLLDEQRADLFWEERTEPASDSKHLRELVVSKFSQALKAEDALSALNVFQSFRVLCAHRNGAFGVSRLNESIRDWLVSARLVSEQGEMFKGRLLIIRENDYGIDLHNGDVGLCWPDAEGRLMVYFALDNETVRAVSAAQLPLHETAYAMTIHKSQGSEHDEVAVILPSEESQLLSRELIYTAVTRAKKKVFLYGSRASLLRAADHSVSRHSGLGDAIGVHVGNNSSLTV